MKLRSPKPAVARSSYIKSGSIGINITHSQDTAVPCPYNNRGRDTALPCPGYHSDATGNDITACLTQGDRTNQGDSRHTLIVSSKLPLIRVLS
ncbi:hypothetical protein [Microcoleus sp. BROC3]|uniref:hypothetical protein n=1 Tax=Microcoleus sp. BROC3 TaxID=3055323 RepID=UPI002FD2C770